MLNIMLSGCNGQMGKAISELVSKNSNMKIIAGIDIRDGESPFGYPVYSDPSKYEGDVDVLIDFSNPSSLSPLIDFCIEREVPAVLATTGYTDEQISLIEQTASRIPIFRSSNMSVGICLITELACQAASLLGTNFDIEITERHHSKKLDSPSGTAISIADSISKVLSYQPIFKYGRHSARERRQPEEIGVHSIRGGTIIGDHEVLFAGDDELIEIRHSAHSRKVFANGALVAAEYISKLNPGLYNMKNLVDSVINPK